MESQGVQVIFPIDEGIAAIKGGAGSCGKLRALTESLCEKTKFRNFTLLCLVIEVRREADIQIVVGILERSGVRILSDSALTHSNHTNSRTISAMITGGESRFESHELFRLLVLSIQHRCEGDVRLYGYVMSAPQQKINISSYQEGSKRKKSYTSEKGNDQKISLDHLTLHSVKRTKKILSAIEWGDVAINNAVVEIIASDECIIMCDWISPLENINNAEYSIAPKHPVHSERPDHSEHPEQWCKVRLAESVRGFFAGYHCELTQMQSLRAQFQENSSGLIVHLHGMAGIGKTRLIKELFDSPQKLKDPSQASTERVVVSHLSQEAFIYGYTHVHVLIMQLLGLELSQTTDELRAKLKATGINPASQLVILELAEIPLSKDESRMLAIMPTHFRKGEELSAVTELIAYTTQSCSLILVIDDCQGIERNSESGNRIVTLLKAILDTVKNFPVFVVLSTRSSDSFSGVANVTHSSTRSSPFTSAYPSAFTSSVKPPFTTNPYSRSTLSSNIAANHIPAGGFYDSGFWPRETLTIELTGVSNDASKTIAVHHISNCKSIIEANALDITIDVEHCIDAAYGNPRYIRQSVFAALLSPPIEVHETRTEEQRGTLCLASGAGRYHSLCHAQLNNQMQALNVLQTTLIKVIALIGESVPKRFIEHVKQSSSLNLFVSLGWLKSLPDNYRFVHPFIQQGVLSSIAPSEIKELHQFCAELYSDNKSLPYLTHATQADDHSATNQVLDIASQNLENFEFESALSLAECVLNCVTGKQRSEGLKIKADCLAALHQVKPAIAVYEQALKEDEEGAHRKELFNALSSLYNLVLRKPEAQIEVFIKLQQKYARLERNKNSRQKDKPLEIAHQKSVSLLKRLTLSQYDFEQGEWQKALINCQLGLAQSQNKNDLVKEAQFSELLARIQREQLNISSAISTGLQAVQLARMTGRIQLELDARLVLSENLLSANSLEITKNQLHSSLALVEAVAAPRYSVLFLSLQAWYFHLSHQPEESFKAINLSILLMEQYDLESKVGCRVYATQALIFGSSNSQKNPSDKSVFYSGQSQTAPKYTEIQSASQALSIFEPHVKESGDPQSQSQLNPQAIKAAYHLNDTDSLNRNIYKLINNGGLNPLSPRQDFYLCQARIAIRIINEEATIKEVDEFNQRACELQLKSACFHLSTFHKGY